jgi:hypothetical protein
MKSDKQIEISDKHRPPNSKYRFIFKIVLFA